MSNKGRSHAYSDKADRTVYALTDEKKKLFYIDFTLSHRLRKEYSEHLNLYNIYTCPYIIKMAFEGERPCMHILERVNESKVQCFSRVIVWNKILTENGYSAMVESSVTEYARNLNQENLKLYFVLKSLNIGKILSCKNCAVVYYNRHRCPNYKSYE